MADPRASSSKLMEVEMKSPSQSNPPVGLKFHRSTFLCPNFGKFIKVYVFLFKKFSFMFIFSQDYKSTFLAVDSVEAVSRPHEKDEESEEFDPWALPELQNLGPKWSGKFSSHFMFVSRRFTLYLTVLVFSRLCNKSSFARQQNSTDGESLFASPCRSARSSFSSASCTCLSVRWIFSAALSDCLAEKPLVKPLPQIKF